MKDTAKKIVIIFSIIGLVTLGYIAGFNFSGVKLEKPDQEIIDLAIQQTEQQTGSQFSLIPLYIETGELVGFLSDIDNSGKYMYLGTNDYPSIFQES